MIVPPVIVPPPARVRFSRVMMLWTLMFPERIVMVGVPATSMRTSSMNDGTTPVSQFVGSSQNPPSGFTQEIVAVRMAKWMDWSAAPSALPARSVTPEA